MHTLRFKAAVLAAVSATLLLASCALLPQTGASSSTSPSSEPTAETSESPTPLNAKGKKTTATAVLNALNVAESDKSGYKRSAFKHWITTDGCDTREWVLVKEAKGGKVDGCDVTGATWHSDYDNKDTTDPGSFDIDHRVPLAEAWASGASEWSSERREAYANDLGYPEALIAVTAASNRSKSDQDPSTWMPPDKGNWCSYLKNWIAVKYRWSLNVDPDEKAFIASNLKGCNPTMKVPPLANVK